MLGSEAVMIPPTPHLTRYKREVAVAQVCFFGVDMQAMHART